MNEKIEEEQSILKFSDLPIAKSINKTLRSQLAITDYKVLKSQLDASILVRIKNQTISSADIYMLEVLRDIEKENG